MRFFLAVFLFLLGVLALIPPVAAQERSEDECLKLHPEIRSPVEMVRCTFDIDASEASLRSAYETAELVRASETAELASPESRSRLKKAQKAWLSFRDRQCDFEAGGTGTGRSSSIIACKADMNRARAKELDQASYDKYLVANDVSDPKSIAERTAEFGKDLHSSGIPGRVQSCETIVDVSAGRSNVNHSYGAICKVVFKAEPRDYVLCNDAMVGHFAVAASFTYDRAWVVRFVKNNCVGG